jgi:undecaprenyl-diphosphatase
VPKQRLNTDLEPPLPPLWPYLLAFCALVALGLAFGEMAKAARLGVADGLDLHAVTWANHHHHDWPGLEHLFQWVTWLGDTAVATTATVLVALVLVVLGRLRIARFRMREAVFWLAVAISGRLLCIVLKLWFQRARPPVDWHREVMDDDVLSFPSGHSMFAAVFFTMLAILITHALPRRWRWLRLGVIGICVMMALLIGASRVWLCVHYPTDVAGGLLLGVAWVLIAYVLRFGWAHWRLWRRHRAG